MGVLVEEQAVVGARCHRHRGPALVCHGAPWSHSSSTAHTVDSPPRRYMDMPLASTAPFCRSAPRCVVHRPHGRGQQHVRRRGCELHAFLYCRARSSSIESRPGSLPHNGKGRREGKKALHGARLPSIWRTIGSQTSDDSPPT